MKTPGERKQTVVLLKQVTFLKARNCNKNQVGSQSLNRRRYFKGSCQRHFFGGEDDTTRFFSRVFSRVFCSPKKPPFFFFGTES